MIKVKDGYAKLVGTTASGSASHILLSNGGVKAVSDFVAVSALDNYLPLSGGTMTGVITMPINYQIQWGSNSMMIYGADTNAISIVAPLGLYVNSKEVWHAGNDGSGSGLDADLLDGRHSSGFAIYEGIVGANDSSGVASIGYTYATQEHGGLYAGGFINFGTNGYFCQLNGNVSQSALAYRFYNTEYGKFSDWKSIAFTDSNVASATKLQTARTIWGQSFDGSGNVSGNMTGVGSITMSSDVFLNNNMGIAIKNTSGAYKYILLLSNNNRAYFGWPDLDSYIRGNNVNITYGSSQTSGIYLNSSGNVGIGTLNPSCKLEVNGSLKISDYIDIRENGGKNRFTSYVYSGIGRLYSYNDDTGYNDLYVGQNSTNAIVVKANGNVGIGTGSPAYKLDVSGDIATSLYLRIKAWSGYGSGSCDMWFDGNKTKLIMASGAVFGYNVDIEGTLHMTNDHKIFWHDDSANYYISSPNTATSAMLEYKAYGGHRFYGGNVGIGVESPEYKLHVSGSIYGSYGKFGGILINKGYGNNTGTDTIETATSGNMLYINYYHKGGLNLCLGGGNVGIGTTNPVHKLDVNGTIYGSHYYGDAITLYTRGNGTYTRAWISAKDSSGDFIIEAPLTAESSGTRAPITLTWRGGYPSMGGLKITGYSEAVLGGNKIWHEGNDGSGSGLDADLLDGKHLSSFITYELATDYVGASFNSENLSKKAAITYIEYWDGTGGWFNSRWGLVLAISGFHRVGSSDSYVLLGGGGHKAVSDFAPASHNHNGSYVYTGGMVNGACAVIPTYNGETGWHRIATIDGRTGYGSWILYLCGDWSWASNTNAILHINTMHTAAKITQVSGIVGFVTDVRLVPISANNYYVDVYVNYSGANTPGTVYCYFLGNGAITTRTTAEKITASVSTAASITLVTGTKTNDNSYAAHFYENSDIRYKTIINNLAIKANQLANLPLFDFTWLDNEDLLNTGTSAQAVQELLPYIVSGTDKLTLDYGVLGTIAGITACKELTEQEKEINELKEQIKFLKDEINNLKTNKLWQS